MKTVTKETILVIDDEPVVRDSIALLLEDRGYTTITAGNGAIGWQIYNDVAPDLIVSDLRMPVLDGFQLLQKVFAQDQSMPVIIMSGAGTMESIVKALRLGAWDYLEKPIMDVEVLFHVVKRNLEKRNLIMLAKSYQEQLEESLRLRTEELELHHSQNLQAQKLESVGRLASGIAHEINTPIQFVGSNVDFLGEAFLDVSGLVGTFLQLLKETKLSENSTEIAEKIETILDEIDWEYLSGEIPQAIEQTREGIQRVAALVQAMKEFSHPGGKEKQKVNLNRIIETTRTVAKNEWKYVSNVELDLKENLPLISCLSDEMGQVILNLLVNAAQAIGEKLGDNPEGEKGVITLRTENDDRYVKLSISDTGSGIADAVKSKIFDPFFTTKGVGRGTGQGLAIVYDVIVGKHHGEIDVTSRREGGTIFTILLPFEESYENL